MSYIGVKPEQSSDEEVDTLTNLTDLAVSGASQAIQKTGENTFANVDIPAGGSGDVVKVGTPVDNQVGVWTGDGTLEGDTALTFNTSTDLLTTGSLAIAGVEGAGFITLVAQSSNPSAPAAGTLLLHSSTTQGFTRMEQDNEATTNIVLGRDNVVIAKNTSGGTISKGMPVYVTGSTGNVPNIAKAKADSITTMPAIGVVMDDILDNAFGQIMVLGNLANFDTSAFSTGEQVYVSPDTAGALTNTRPSGTTNIVQLVGRILVDGVGNGSMQVATAPFLGNSETGTNAATWSGTAINLSGLTASEIVITDGSKNLASAAVATYPSLTELSYVKGVTSAIQTQLGTKAPLASPTFTGTVTLPTGLTGVLRADTGVVSVDSDVTDLVTAGTTSAAGKLELAITSEIDTGTDSTRAMPVDQFVASNRNVRYILFRVIDKTTDWSADASTAVGGDLVIPFTGTIVDIEADVDTAGTTGTAIVDVNLNGSTIMTTNKLKWDSTEKSTRTYSGTAPGLTTTAVTAGDIITLDIDTNHTTKSKGLTLFLALRLS